MGNQSSILADMVYRVFPTLEPSQHQVEAPQMAAAFQGFFSPRATPGHTRGGGLAGGGGAGGGGGGAFLSRNGSLGGSSFGSASELLFGVAAPYFGASSPSFGSSLSFNASSSSMYKRTNSLSNASGGYFGASAPADQKLSNGELARRIAAEKSAAMAYRARFEPQAMGMSAFEVASLSLRVLDLWDRLSPDSIRLLKRSFKEVSGPQAFLFGPLDLRWRITGVEMRKELGLLTASIASTAERCSPELVDEIQMHCWNVSRKRRRHSLFEEDEEATLMATLDGMVSVTGRLRDEMEKLDNLVPSSHPLSQANDPDPFAGKKNTKRGAPSPVITQAKKQQMIRAQLTIVHQLQEECLWTQDFDWTLLLLSVALAILWHRFREVFGRPQVENSEMEKTLGYAGLSLHYSNTLLLLDSLVQRPNVLANTGARDEIYSKLPSSVKAGLRMRLRNLHIPFDSDVVMELRRTVTFMLTWMVPLAESTMAWESERSYDCNVARRKRINLGETLYFADRDQFELLLIELLVALTHTLGPKYRQSRKAALASAELHGKLDADDDTFELPPAPRVTLPKLERKNGRQEKERNGPQHVLMRKATPLPRQEPSLKLPTDLSDEFEESESESEREIENESDGGEGAQGRSPSRLPNGRVRRPAPRPPPGFGGGGGNQKQGMFDPRPQLMG